LKRRVLIFEGFIYSLKLSDIPTKNAVMLNIAVKAAASRDCSGKPFLSAGKMQGCKKACSGKPYTNVDGTTEADASKNKNYRIYCNAFSRLNLFFTCHSYGVLTILLLMFLLTFCSSGAVD
jgi:hypothetical protein